MNENIVLPGQIISTDAGFLRGLGTYLVKEDDQNVLIASSAGTIERVNKLISVKSSNSRYIGEGKILSKINYCTI